VHIINSHHDSTKLLFEDRKDDQQIMRCATLHATAASLLDFAREKIEHEFFMINWEEVGKSATEIGALDTEEFGIYFDKSQKTIEDPEIASFYPGTPAR